MVCLDGGGGDYGDGEYVLLDRGLGHVRPSANDSADAVMSSCSWEFGACSFSSALSVLLPPRPSDPLNGWILFTTSTYMYTCSPSLRMTCSRADYTSLKSTGQHVGWLVLHGEWMRDVCVRGRRADTRLVICQRARQLAVGQLLCGAGYPTRGVSSITL